MGHSKTIKQNNRKVTTITHIHARASLSPSSRRYLRSSQVFSLLLKPKTPKLCWNCWRKHPSKPHLLKASVARKFLTLDNSISAHRKILLGFFFSYFGGFLRRGPIPEHFFGYRSWHRAARPSARQRSNSVGWAHWRGSWPRSDRSRPKDSAGSCDYFDGYRYWPDYRPPMTATTTYFDNNCCLRCLNCSAERLDLNAVRFQLTKNRHQYCFCWWCWEGSGLCCQCPPCVVQGDHHPLRHRRRNLHSIVRTWLSLFSYSLGLSAKF